MICTPCTALLVALVPALGLVEDCVDRSMTIVRRLPHGGLPRISSRIYAEVVIWTMVEDGWMTG